MALKIADGFDHYNATADLTARSGFLQWQTPVNPPPTMSFVAGLSAHGKAVQITDSSLSTGAIRPLRAVFGDRNSEAYCGIRVLIPTGTVGPATNLFLMLQDTVAGAPQLTVIFNAGNYSIQILRGDNTGTSLFLSANNVWSGDVSNFVEVGATVANSGGVAQVRVNGVMAASISGVDTQATANAWWDALDFAAAPLSSGTAFVVLDDLYYADNTTDPGASPNNTFLGDVGTRTLFATGDGSINFTPNSGANNFSRVNETAMDSDTSYNSSATPGDEDQFSFQPITNVIAIIYGVQVTIAARKDDIGPRVIKTGLVSGGTTDYGADHALPDNYSYFTDLWVLDPDTGVNWTRTGVNAALGLYNLVS